MLRLALQRTCSATQAAAVGCSSSALRALPCAASVRGFSAETGKEEREITNPAVLELADRIVQLNLLEVSDLTDLLRKRLNLPASYGMPMMAAGAVASAPAEAGGFVDEGTSSSRMCGRAAYVGTSKDLAVCA